MVDEPVITRFVSVTPFNVTTIVFVAIPALEIASKLKVFVPWNWDWPLGYTLAARVSKLSRGRFVEVDFAFE